jgi:flagellar protein FliS
MQNVAQEEYLTTQVMTATPQKLQLMVIESALRSTMRAKALYEAQQPEAALLANLQGQKAITTVLASLNYEAGSDIVRQVVEVYIFVYKSLVYAHVNQDTTKLADAIRVLEIERETWRQVCEQVEGPQRHEAPPVPAVPAPMSSRSSIPLSSLTLPADDNVCGGFSLEA